MYETRIIIHSILGCCPITKRIGSYCDELLRETVYVNSRDEAVSLLEGKKEELFLKHGAVIGGAWFYMPTYENQNQNTYTC